MVWQRVRIALLACILAAAAELPVRADEAPKPAATPAPATCKVWVNEWVPEKYECTRTCYKWECKQEAYTAHRCECVPEVRTRTYCVCVPTWEERTFCKDCWTCKPVTKTVRKCVDKGHWECREVPCGPSLHDRLKHLCHKDCCECEPCPKTKTVKCWVPCKVWEERCVTCYQRVCEKRPVTCKVCVYKKETRTEQCQVMTHKLVAYQATRTVKCCVPVQEKVTCCRMVCKKVEKEVPVCTCCCAPKCHHFRGHGHKHSGCCD